MDADADSVADARLVDVVVELDELDDDGLRVVTVFGNGQRLARAQVDPDDARTWWCIAFAVEVRHGVGGALILRRLREQLGDALPVWGLRETHRADRIAIAA